MSGDGFDLLVGAADVCKTCRRRLAQAVSGTMRQTGLVAALPKPVAEACRRERCAALCHQKRQIVFGKRIERVHQSGMQRNHQRRAGLFLTHRDQVTRDVLPTHSDDIAATLAGAEQQSESETRTRVAWMSRLKLSDLL